MSFKFCQPFGKKNQFVGLFRKFKIKKIKKMFAQKNPSSFPINICLYIQQKFSKQNRNLQITPQRLKKCFVFCFVVLCTGGERATTNKDSRRKTPTPERCFLRCWASRHQSSFVAFSSRQGTHKTDLETVPAF